MSISYAGNEGMSGIGEVSPPSRVEGEPPTTSGSRMELAGLEPATSWVRYRLRAIDEIRLVVAPAIAGRGRRLLDGLPPIRLESLRSATSPKGYLLADYRISR
jgi:hypothetical protein